MIKYLDRRTKKICEEKVYGEKFLRFVYRGGLFGKIAKIVSRTPLVSKLYGWLQNSPFSRKKIEPFIKEFGVDTSEFLDPVESFDSFNAFFVRKLKPKVRPLSEGAVIPADGRYLVFPDVRKQGSYFVKGQEFDIPSLLGNEKLGYEYADGSLVIARLCPVDYHRFHFPFDCEAGHPSLMNGWTYSVNPIAVRKQMSIFWENKRVITELNSDRYGQVLYIEVGATCVGSIHQTFSPGLVRKGDEKGFFSFGGSTLLLLFKKNSIEFASDLIKSSEKGIEVLCQMGSQMSSDGDKKKWCNK